MDRWLLACLALPNIIILVWWFRNAPRVRWALVGAFVLPAIAWAPVMRVITMALEGPYKQGLLQSDAEAIVVFPGAIEPAEPERPEPIASGDSYLRGYYAAWLYKHLRQIPILVCGGPDPSSSGSWPPFSHTVRRMLIQEGVPPEMVWTEDESQSTYENAMYGARILRQKKIHHVILVTEAYHMQRAERCLRKQGLQVDPAPCSFRSRFRAKREHVLPSREDFTYSVDALHELVGLVWYTLRGRI